MNWLRTVELDPWPHNHGLNSARRWPPHDVLYHVSNCCVGVCLHCSMRWIRNILFGCGCRVCVVCGMGRLLLAVSHGGQRVRLLLWTVSATLSQEMSEHEDCCQLLGVSRVWGTSYWMHLILLLCLFYHYQFSVLLERWWGTSACTKAMAFYVSVLRCPHIIDKLCRWTVKLASLQLTVSSKTPPNPVSNLVEKGGGLGMRLPASPYKILQEPLLCFIYKYTSKVVLLQLQQPPFYGPLILQLLQNIMVFSIAPYWFQRIVCWFVHLFIFWPAPELYVILWVNSYWFSNNFSSLQIQSMENQAVSHLVILFVVTDKLLLASRGSWKQKILTRGQSRW